MCVWLGVAQFVGYPSLPLMRFSCSLIPFLPTYHAQAISFPLRLFLTPRSSHHMDLDSSKINGSELSFDLSLALQICLNWIWPSINFSTNENAKCYNGCQIYVWLHQLEMRLYSWQLNNMSSLNNSMDIVHSFSYFAINSYYFFQL